MPEPRHIAEQPADLVHGVGFWAVRRNQCRWPLTDILPISDFKYCGAKVVRRCWCADHVAQAFNEGVITVQAGVQVAPDSTPASPPLPGPASPAAIEQAPVTACRCVLALQRWGVDPDEAGDIVARMLAAPRLSDRLAIWVGIEPRLRRARRDLRNLAALFEPLVIGARR
jgi:hypothetical protein